MIVKRTIGFIVGVVAAMAGIWQVNLQASHRDKRIPHSDCWN
jgi:hypothetical protein